MAARRSAQPPSPEPRIQLPELVKDPSWSLQPWPIVVTVEGFSAEIPAMPAADWLSVLGMGDSLDLEDILPGLAVNEDEIDEALIRGELDLVELHKVTLDVIGAVTGRTWYVSLNIIAAAVGSWDALGGELVLRGVDASKLSIAAWIDAVYLIMVRAMDNQQLLLFTSKIQVPPPGFEDEDADKGLMTRDEFSAMSFE